MSVNPVLPICIPIYQYEGPSDPVAPHCANLVVDYFGCWSQKAARPINDHQVRIITDEEYAKEGPSCFCKFMIAISYITIIIPIIMAIALFILRCGKTYTVAKDQPSPALNVLPFIDNVAIDTRVPETETDISIPAGNSYSDDEMEMSTRLTKLDIREEDLQLIDQWCTQSSKKPVIHKQLDKLGFTKRWSLLHAMAERHSDITEKNNSQLNVIADAILYSLLKPIFSGFKLKLPRKRVETVKVLHIQEVINNNPELLLRPPYSIFHKLLKFNSSFLSVVLGAFPALCDIEATPQLFEYLKENRKFLIYPINARTKEIAVIWNSDNLWLINTYVTEPAWLTILKKQHASDTWLENGLSTSLKAMINVTEMRRWLTPTSRISTLEKLPSLEVLL